VIVTCTPELYGRIGGAKVVSKEEGSSQSRRGGGRSKSPYGELIKNGAMLKGERCTLWGNG